MDYHRMMQFHVVLWVVVSLAATDGPPADEATELTPCPFTIPVLALEVNHPGEVCEWLKDGHALYDVSTTRYSSKINKTHHYLIILFVSEKDNGLYECQIRSRDGHYEPKVAYKLAVKRQEECNIRQDNNSSDDLRGIFCAVAIILVLNVIFAVEKVSVHFWKKRARHTKLQTLKKDNSEMLNDTFLRVTPRPIQVSNENDLGIEMRHETSTPTAQQTFLLPKLG